ncbi:hypothetical protein AB0L70_01220 [Kribbella sp. NPDC051952]|uniref:hypothetical protein n=1 Tax=Kribbella sp. NPDC051952 TaxID=3154851 RepID=UPI00344A2303
MPRRAATAQSDGPVMVEVLMLGRNGTVRVEVDPSVERATIEVLTDDPSGPSADAVTEGAVHWEAQGRDPELVATGKSPTVEHPHPVPGGRLVARIQTPGIDPREGSRVEVVARVPINSAVDVDADTADVDVLVSGAADREVGAADVSVASRGGEVRVARSASVFAEGSRHTWVGESGEVAIHGGEGSVEIGRVTQGLTVQRETGSVVVGDVAGDHSSVQLGDGDITVNVSGSGEHTFRARNGLVTGTRTGDSSVQATDSRGPVQLHDAGAAEGAATGAAAAAPVTPAKAGVASVRHGNSPEQRLRGTGIG